MADDAHYTAGDFTGKRKYDDSTTPPPSSARRQTGFSAPIIHSQSPDSASAYNTVPPPPVDEIELAKQKAQEIAARLFNNAEAKRPKFDNGGGGGGYDNNDSKGFSSGPADYGQKPYISAPSVPSAYGGYGGGSGKKIDIPNGRVGVIIGKGGETIKYLQLQSGAKIQVTRDMDHDPQSLTRAVELTGTSEAIAKAEQLIKDVLAEAESGGSGIVSRRLPGQQGGAEQFVMQVPNNKVGLIIGKGGETIKSMQASSGARIQVIPLHLPPGDTSTERTVQIDGSSDQIEAAKQLVNEVISGENRLRNPMGVGGYSQQGYQARPQTNWAPPGQQMQQQGYGYMQPGGYPGQPTQYTQPPYGGYPGQQTAQGGGGGGGGGYDYYNQQQAPQTQPPGGPDGSSYGYSQQGQTYGQDGYGGYGAPQSGYSQQGQTYDQQGYANPTSGYNVSSETSEGKTSSYGAQGDSASQAPPPTSAPQSGYAQPAYGAVPPTSQPGYGAVPPSGYGGYGPPPTQKPPVTPTYGQQSPQGGYAQPAPYGGGYGAGGYAQASYGQQPPAYGSSYGSGYPQQPPPAYSADGAAPAPQASQPSGGGAVAKASPQS
ncbi:putative K domain-containing protein [Helianthus annuus]|uniref:K domain-containing protein n=1 Tax=Helianthus annuus TaxID=4232 RepID=A0A251U9X2_HELAN|nr:far upstream element-binding protein 1 [Helianthus annuus]KAF5797829.1 putative K domain-containing protein [Helianthus annuus]KAJ0907193.1 putative K domain-containing protein [Helianthus annuus]